MSRMAGPFYLSRNHHDFCRDTVFAEYEFWSYCGLGIVMRTSSDWVRQDGRWIPDLLTYPRREMSGFRGLAEGEQGEKRAWAGGPGRRALSAAADGWRSAGRAEI
jgi:hypothetical protein